VEVEQARQAGWIEVSAPVDVALLALLRRDLDDGESEVIALAVEKQAELVNKPGKLVVSPVPINSSMNSPS